MPNLSGLPKVLAPASRLFFESRRWPKIPRRGSRRLSRPAPVADSAFFVQDEYRTSTGARIVHAQQYYRGLRVYDSVRVVEMRGRKIIRTTPELFRLPAGLVVKPGVLPADAVEAALTFLKLRGGLPDGFEVAATVSAHDGQLVDQPAFVQILDTKQPVRLHLEVFPTPGRARLAWVLDFVLNDHRRFECVVAADTKPRVLRFAQTNTCAGVSFDATWRPLPAPVAPETRQFPIPPLAAPAGYSTGASHWFAGGALAQGHNVRCYQAPLDPQLLGTATADNAFVWANVLHDFFTAFGFDHASHAFENDDPLRVICKTLGNPIGGEFDNWVDGTEPRLYLHASPYPNGVHAALDPSILIHEYAHGVSNRLVGGSTHPRPFTSNQAKGLSEGLSDYFAMTLLNYARRGLNGAGEITRFGGDFQPGGMRDYATDPGALPGGWGDIYAVGKVWCAAMVDGRDAIVAAGATENDTDCFMWQATIDMLKAMPPTAASSKKLTLVHARDTLVAEARKIEIDNPSFTGSGNRLLAAFKARKI